MIDQMCQVAQIDAEDYVEADNYFKKISQNAIQVTKEDSGSALLDEMEATIIATTSDQGSEMSPAPFTDEILNASETVAGILETQAAVPVDPYKEAVQELEEYMTYEDGWDGYFGVPFVPDLIQRTKTVLDIARSTLSSLGITPYRIIPGPASDGSVDLEFWYGSRKLIITIYPKEPQFDIYRQDKNGHLEETLSVAETAVDRQLNWLADEVRLQEAVDYNR